MFNFEQTPRATLSNLRNLGHLQCPLSPNVRPGPRRTLAGVIRKCTDRPMDLKVAQLAQLLLESGFDNLSERERRDINHVASRLHATHDVNHALAKSWSA